MLIKGGNYIRVDYLSKEQRKAVADRLQGQYLIIWEIGCSTGLRISDILCLTVRQLTRQYTWVTERKTHKRRRIYIQQNIRSRVAEYAAKHDLQPDSKIFTVSRQTVWKHLKRAAELENICTNVGTHTMRKTYSRAYINKGYSLDDLHERLNHTHLSDTIGYITSNQQLGLDSKGKQKKRGKKRVS